MAGYWLYSIDWKKFQKFVEKPTKKQLLAVASMVSDGLDAKDGEFEKGDPVHDWPSEPEELIELVQERLAMDDWYGDLSDTAKNIWEGAIFGICNGKDLGFECESDGVYWDVVELAQKHHKVPHDRYTKHILSGFGQHLYRFNPGPKYRLRFDRWVPYHALYTTDEVQQLIEAFQAAFPTIEASGDEGAITDYEEELMPTLDRIAERGRMLFIQLDT